MEKIEKIFNIISKNILDKKGKNLVGIDIRNISSTASYVFIAEGNIDRHVKAISKNLQNSLKEVGERPAFVDGYTFGDWVILDYIEFVIHVFVPCMREKYNIEDLFSDGQLLTLNNNPSCYLDLNTTI